METYVGNRNLDKILVSTLAGRFSVFIVLLNTSKQIYK